MSGHSKWHSIKHKKGAADAIRGNIFTKHAKLIAVAARGGGDPDMNPSLRTAIDNAKAENMPNINIERAILKGTGELKDQAAIEELSYEGYGPGGVAIFVQILTDNKNRTASDIRHIFSKHGGNMGENGCVAWMFEQKGLIDLDIEKNKMDPEEMELLIIDAGAEDIEKDGTMLNITTKPEELNQTKKNLEEQGLIIEKATLELLAKETVRIEDEKMANKIIKMMEELDDNDDVKEVSSNFDIDEGLLE